MPKTWDTKRAGCWDFLGNKELLQWIGAKSASKRGAIWHTTALSRGNGFRTVLPEGLRILKLYTSYGDMLQSKVRAFKTFPTTKL